MDPKQNSVHCKKFDSEECFRMIALKFKCRVVFPSKWESQGFKNEN